MQYLQQFTDRNTTELETWLEKNKENYEVNTDEIEHIIDYFMGIENPNYKLSYKEAKKKAEGWAKSMSRDTTDEMEGVDYEVVLKFEDGFKYVKLLTETAYKNETANMRHCIKSYWGRDNVVYSLRDKKNLPHATCDILRDASDKIQQIQQIQGKGNNNIDGKYRKYNIEFLEHMGFSINKRFMEKLGYKHFPAKYTKKIESRVGEYVLEKDFVKRNLLEEYIGKVHLGDLDWNKDTLVGMPVVLGDFGIYAKITSLKGMKEVGGDFYCSHAKITSLEGMKEVGGSFDCSHTKITSLKGMQKVGGNFYCSYTKITSLEGMQKVGGDFYCRRTNLKSLEGMKEVGGSFDCSYTKITSLEGMQKVGGDFYCRRTNLKSLEGMQKVGGSFDCSHTKITSLEGMQKVGGWFDCRYTKITSLKGMKEVGGSFDCRHTKITSLKGMQKVGGSFYCSHTKITSLEGMKEVGGDFYCSHTKIISLKGMKEVGGSFDCRYTSLKSLKGMVNVGGSVYSDVR